MAVAVTRALGQSGGGARSSFGADPRGEAAAAGLGKVDRSTGGGEGGAGWKGCRLRVTQRTPAGEFLRWE